MQLSQIHISEDSLHRLSVLRSRTELSLEILCQIGLMLSLAETSEPTIDVGTTAESEFTRLTLTEVWNPLIIELVKQRCIANIDSEDDCTFVKYFHAHLNRGVHLLHGRVKGLEDLGKLLLDQA